MMSVSTMIPIHCLLYQHHLAIVNELTGLKFVTNLCCFITLTCIATTTAAMATSLAESCDTNMM